MKTTVSIFKFMTITLNNQPPIVVGLLMAFGIITTLIVTTWVPWILYNYIAPYFLSNITGLVQFLHPDFWHFLGFELLVMSLTWWFKPD
jgi:hypothetical protein